MVEIDDEMCAFLQTGGALVLGTHDGTLAPEITRGWGIHVLPDRRTVELCVGLPSSRRTLGNIAENGRVAATFVLPLVYRQVQFKGRVIDVLDVTDEDRARAARHQQAFMRQVEPLGIPSELCPRFWDHDPGWAKLRIALEEAYEQTPGPEAGRRL